MSIFGLHLWIFQLVDTALTDAEALRLRGGAHRAEPARPGRAVRREAARVVIVVGAILVVLGTTIYLLSR